MLNGKYVCWPCMNDGWAADQHAHWSVLLQVGCLLNRCHSIIMPSFVTQSCMSAGVVLLYLPYLLVWCLTISRACWCDASLKVILSGVVPHYQPLQLVRCLVIGHAFWCCASLSAVTAGAVPRYRPCLLVWCVTISRDSWCGASL